MNQTETRRAVIAECIDVLDHVDTGSLVADLSIPIGADRATATAAYVRATLVEKLRDLGRIAPPWNPTQYDEAK